MVVTANRPPDEILAMLRPYAERGVVRVIEEEAYTYAQSEWVTRMARLAAAEKHLAKSAERLERAQGKLRESEQRRRSTPST